MSGLILEEAATLKRKRENDGTVYMNRFHYSIVTAVWELGMISMRNILGVVRSCSIQCGMASLGILYLTAPPTVEASIVATFVYSRKALDETGP